MSRTKSTLLVPVFCILVLVSGSCSLLSPTLREADWPMWRFDSQRSGASPHEVPDTLYLQWARQYPPQNPTWDDPLNQDLMQFDLAYEPIVHRGTLFFGSNSSDCLIAVSGASGEELWRFYVDGPVRFPAVALDGRVYFVSDDGNLYCVGAESGELLWKFRGAPSQRKLLGNERLISTWPARGGPVLHEGIVYFGVGIWPFMGVFINAVDAESGELVWQNDSSGPKYMLQPHNSPAFAGVAPQGNFVVSGDKLLVPCGRSVPACFDLKTGEMLYYQLSQNNKTGGAFVAAQEKFFVNYHRDGEVHLYELSSGDVAIKNVGQMPVITDEMLFSSGKSITALDISNIRQTSVKKVLAFDSKKKAGTVEEKVWALDPLWECDVDATGTLIQAGAKLFAGGDGIISAVTIPSWGGSPEIVWQAELDGTVSRIVAAGDHVFAVTLEGNIYAFGPDEPEKTATYPFRPSKSKVKESSIAEAESILDVADVREGYCLYYGASDGELVEALALNSDLKIVVVEPDPAKVDQLRRKFDSRGLYGERISVLPGTLTGTETPPYMAALTIVEDLLAAGYYNDSPFFAKLYHSLRPYGGTAYIASDNRGVSDAYSELRTLGLPGGQVSKIERNDDLLEAVQRAAKELQQQQESPAVQAEIRQVAQQIEAQECLLLVRAGALPGSDDWTHQYGNIANTVKSDDQLVKLPLGVLWFGGSSNLDVLPRHGHGPPEQVVGGRLFIEGIKSFSARDVYTGRMLWKRELSRLDTFGFYYDETYADAPLVPVTNQVHIPGANSRGTNFVATEDRIYLALKNSCLVLDPETGKTIDEFRLPVEAGEQNPPEWAYLGVYGDYLIAGAGFADYLKALELDEIDPRMKTQLNAFYNYDQVASKRLVVMDRTSGKVIWSRKAKFGFWHNGITAADGQIFCIDRLPHLVEKALKKRLAKPRVEPAELLALRAKDGSTVWSNNKDAFGTWLSYSEDQHVLLQAGRSSRDMILGEPKGLMAISGKNGTALWSSDVSDGGPYILHGDTIITEKTAYNLLTGKQKMRVEPLTGEEAPWVIRRDYGCNYIISSEHLLTFRSAAAGFYDLANDGGTGTFGGFKSGCTSNLIAANGVLNAPDYTRTCSCSYQNQTSLALIHMPELEMWTTYYSLPKSNFISHSSSAVLLADLDSNLVFANEKASDLLGYKKPQELEKLSLEDVLQGDGVGGNLVNTLKEKRQWSGNLLAREESGAEREVLVLARVLSDEDLSPIAMMFQLLEIDEPPVAFAGLDGELTHSNDAFSELWKVGGGPSAGPGRKLTQLWKNPSEAAAALQSWKKGQAWSGVVTSSRADQSPRNLYLMSRVVTDESAKPPSLVVTCMDVTEAAQLEEEVRSLVRELGSGASLEHFLKGRQPVRRAGFNFGAPGDRKADTGTLWLEIPSVAGPSPEVPVRIEPEDYMAYSHHSSKIRGGEPEWVVGSGVAGASTVSIELVPSSKTSPAPSPLVYDVYLYFAESENLKPGDRVFDVSLQGKTVLENFDILSEAGGPHIGIKKKVEGVRVEDELTINLTPSRGGSVSRTLLSGVEVVAR